ncbi:unnamed protein product, partial [Didymodactylos carnosus]
MAHRLHLVVTNGLCLWLKNRSGGNDEDFYDDSMTLISTEDDNDMQKNSSATTMNSSSQQQDDNDGEIIMDIGEGDSSLEEEDDNDDEIEDADDGMNDHWDEGVICEENGDIATSLRLTTGTTATEITVEEQEYIGATVEKMRTITKMITKSSIISEYVNKVKLRYNIKRTVNLDTKTRWNSTQRSIETFLMNKEAIVALHHEKSNLKLSKSQRNKLIGNELDSEGWLMLDTIETVLRPFKFATEFISGQHYSTIGTAYNAIIQIKEYLEDTSGSSTNLDKLKALLLQRLKQYFFEDELQLQLLQVRLVRFFWN